ncbi:AFG1/ZapE family ATPase [Aliamphritea spongicola]
MARVHRELQTLSGHKNPLQQVAKQFSRECKVICFDEFLSAISAMR